MNHFLACAPLLSFFRLPLLRSVRSGADYNRLRDALRPKDEVKLFYGLYPIAVERTYQNPAFGCAPPNFNAGYLLFDLNPACQFNCLEAVRAMLAGWDIVLAEVPFYIYQQFGMAIIQEAIHQLRVEPLSEEHFRLDTVKYWVERANREGIEAIIEEWRSE